MADAIAHCGLNDDGYLNPRPLDLANRRLSIVGRADGKLPIGNEDRTMAVTATQLWHHLFISGDLAELPTRRPERELAVAAQVPWDASVP